MSLQTMCEVNWAMLGPDAPRQVGDAEGFEDVLDRLLGKLARHHKLTRALPSGGEVQTVGKGEIKKISMMAEDRHIGRKFITRIVNLEQYGIDPEEFASTMQKKFQAGFQIVKAPGANAGKQIEFQGKVMRELITSVSPGSLLDVGGFGEYERSARFCSRLRAM